MPATNPIVSVRVTQSERALLETAAEQARTNLSDFVRRRALEAAEMDVLDHRIVAIPAADWTAFESWVNSPARAVPALRKLAGTPPAWEE